MEGASESGEEKGLCWFGEFEMTPTCATHYHQEEYLQYHCLATPGLLLSCMVTVLTIALPGVKENSEL